MIYATIPALIALPTLIILALIRYLTSKHKEQIKRSTSVSYKSRIIKPEPVPRIEPDWNKKFPPQQLKLNTSKTVTTKIAAIKTTLQIVESPPAPEAETTDTQYETEIHALASMLASEANQAIDAGKFLLRQVLDNGGIKRHYAGTQDEEYSTIPVPYRRKAGQTADEIAHDLGMTETELMRQIRHAEDSKEALPIEFGKKIRRFRIKDFEAEAEDRLAQQWRREHDYATAAD